MICFEEIKKRVKYKSREHANERSKQIKHFNQILASRLEKQSRANRRKVSKRVSSNESKASK